MISSRQVVVAAASLFAALAAMPPSVQADNKPSSGNAATNADNDNDNKRRESKGRRDDDQGEKRGSFGKSQGGQNSKGEKPSGFQFDNKRTAPRAEEVRQPTAAKAAGRERVHQKCASGHVLEDAA